MKNYRVSLLFFLFTAILYAQVQWPLLNSDSQARVIGKVGEVRNSVRLHRGVDINNGTNCANGNCDIYSVNDGVVGWRNGGGNWSQGTSRIEVGSVFYYHCKPKASILAAGLGNTQVEIGDKIGGMIQSGAIHVHLQESSVNYINQNLSPYVDNERPTLTRNTGRFPDGYKIYKNGIRRTSSSITQNNLELSASVTRSGVNYKIIYSKIDIAAEVEDRGVSQTGGVTAGNSAVYAYEYQLQNYTSPNTSNPLYDYTLAFDEAPSTQANDIVLHPNAFGYGVRDVHIITSHASNTPNDRFFNTAIRQNQTENWANNNNLNAHYTGDAQFPDDRYRLYIDAYDVDYADRPNNRLANRIDVPIIIDNFLPYIKKVEVYSPSNTSIDLYKAEWTYSNGNLIFNVNISSNISSSQSQSLMIKVYPSEKLSNLKLKLGNNQYNFQEDSSQDFWIASVTNNTPLSSRVHVLVFEGEDLAGNELLANPQSLPIKLANGNWPNGTITGADTWHEIKVNGGSSAFGADFSTGNSCPNNKQANTNCLQICFNDSSEPSGNIISWLWEFGDLNSSTSSSRNPSFIYSSPGTYDVTLTVTNTSNQTSSITKTITVDDCDSNNGALISSNLTEGESPQVIEFEDLSVGDIYSRQWKILDSSGNNITPSIHFLYGTEDSTNIELVFEESGTFYVSLDIEDYYGNIVTSNTITITISEPPSTDLFVDFNWNSPYYTGILTQFNSQVTGGCGNLSYRWTFNDYNGPSYSFFSNPQHVFSVPGSYSVELCVTDNCGTEVCTTKDIYISNTGSGIVAKMFSPAQNLDWVVYKGTPVSFYDYSTPAANIRSQSWYFDFKSGVSNAPDIYRPYPIDVNTPVTHTYNEVGTYKIRLYVGDDNYQWESFEEKTITVVDDTDYLEIQNVHQTHKQVINDRGFYKIQTRNFDGNMLTKSINNSNGTDIDIYSKDAQGNYNRTASLIYYPYMMDGRNRTFIFETGYEDKVALMYNNISQHKVEVKLFKRNSTNWSSFELLQTIEYQYQHLYPQTTSTAGLIRNAYIKLYKNTLVIGYVKSDENVIYRKYIQVFELNSNNGLFEHKADLSDTTHLDGLSHGYYSNIDVTDDSIVITSHSYDSLGDTYKDILVYHKTENGWVNSIETARLHSTFTGGINGAANKSQNAINNTIVSLYYDIGSTGNYRPDKRINVWEKPTNGWANNPQNALLKNYTDNYDDLAVYYANKSIDSLSKEISSKNVEGITSKQKTTNNDAGNVLLVNTSMISSNGKFIIAYGSRIRDFPTSKVLCLFYKNGNFWKDRDMEDARLYPNNTTSKETNISDYYGDRIDENNNEITQVFRDRTSGRPSYIYTYNLNNINIEGSGICNQNIVIDNQNINNDNLGAEGKNITISQSSFSAGTNVVYKATNGIIIKPNTIIAQGSNFKATIVDCNLIDQ